MLFKLLKFLERAMACVRIVQIYNQTHGNSFIVKMVKKAPASCTFIKRPAHRMNDISRAVIVIFNFPFLGAMYHGVVIVPLNVLAGSKQIKYTIDHSECKLIFSSEFYLTKFEEILNSSEAKAVQYSGIDSLKNSEKVGLNSALNLTQPHTPAVLIYTSGTTGVPKGALLSHKNVIAGGRNTALAHEVVSSDISFCVLPLYHSNCWRRSFGSCFCLQTQTAQSKPICMSSRKRI